MLKINLFRILIVQIKLLRIFIIRNKINLLLKLLIFGIGERRFFKYRCFGFVEKYIFGVVIRKGFDLKFIFNRKEIVLGK